MAQPFLSLHLGATLEPMPLMLQTPSAATIVAGTVASVHRAMNERRRALEPPTEDAMLRCECECHRVECFVTFRISVEAYEEVRVDDDRFVVAPGHQSPGESIISTTSTYVVIHKARGRSETQPTWLRRSHWSTEPPVDTWTSNAPHR
jgi:hypothetical protein